MMARQSLITLASAVPLLIAHMGVSTQVTLSGILKVESNVRPPVSSVAAMPLDAVARAMCQNEVHEVSLAGSTWCINKDHSSLATINQGHECGVNGVLVNCELLLSHNRKGLLFLSVIVNLSEYSRGIW